MSNPIQPPVILVFSEEMFESLPIKTKIALGAQREFSLRFDFEAIARAEDLTGMPLLSGLDSESVAHPRISFVRALLWAALLPDQSKITRTESDALVTRETFGDVLCAVLQAWGTAQGDPEEVAEPEQPSDPPQAQS